MVVEVMKYSDMRTFSAAALVHTNLLILNNLAQELILHGTRFDLSVESFIKFMNRLVKRKIEISDVRLP